MNEIRRVLNRVCKTIVILVLILSLVAIYLTVFPPHSMRFEPISEMIKLVRESKIERVDIYGDRAIFQTVQGERFAAYKEPNAQFLDLLRQAGVDFATSDITIVVRQPSFLTTGTFSSLLLTGAILMLAFVLYRRPQP